MLSETEISDALDRHAAGVCSEFAIRRDERRFSVRVFADPARVQVREWIGADAAPWQTFSALSLGGYPSAMYAVDVYLAGGGR